MKCSETETVRTTLACDPVRELGDMPEFGVMFKFDADYDHVKLVRPRTRKKLMRTG